MRSSAILLLLLSPFLLYAGGAKESPEVGDSRLEIVVSILPQTYLVKSIAGERVSVEVMVPPGKSPSTYEPTPKQVLRLGEADGFITIGVAFEQSFMPVIEKNLPDLYIIEGDKHIEKRSIEEHHHDDEDHDEEGSEESDHSEDLDPHIWLDPLLMKVQARTITDALILLDSQGSEVYEAGYENTIRELDTLHVKIVDATESFTGSTLFTYHPAFGYFTDRYGLEQVAIETGGKEPTPAQLEKVIELAYRDEVKIILVQPEFPIDSAEVVAKAIDGVVIPVSPLRPDYIESMTELAEAITTGGSYE